MFLQKRLIRPAFLLKAFLGIISLLPLGVAAQKRNLVSFSGGYSLPVGQLASETLSGPEAVVAGSGLYGQINFERKLVERFGLRLTGGLNINRTNAQPLIDRYSVLLDKPESYAWQKDVTKWRLGAVLLGPSGYLSLGKTELEGHVQGGLVFVESPGVTLLGTSFEKSPSVEGRVGRASTNAFGFGAGASVRFNLTDLLRLQLTADAIGADAQLRGISTYGKIGSLPPIEGVSNPKRFVSVVNVGAGLVFVF